MRKANNRIKPSRLKKILFLIFAVAVNVSGGKLVEAFYVPLYMDSVLTIAVAAGCGPVFAVVCSVLTHVILCLLDAAMLPFMSCHILTAIFAWLTFRHHRRTFPGEAISAETFMWAGLWSALSNATLGNILVGILFSFQPDWPNTAPPVQGLFIVTKNLTFATYFSGTLTNLADKLLSAAVSWGAYRIVFARKMIGASTRIISD